MSDPSDRLNQIQGQIAAINTDAAQAVEKLAGVESHPSPEITLRNVRMALEDVYAETARALDTVEHQLDDYDDGMDTPRRIIHEHAERIKERYDGPALNIALMLLEQNRREWLHRKTGTNGADGVRRHGLTENQRSWLDSLTQSNHD